VLHCFFFLHLKWLVGSFVYQAQRDFLSDKIRSQLDLHAKVQRRPCGEAAVMEVVRSHSLDGEKIF